VPQRLLRSFRFQVRSIFIRNLVRNIQSTKHRVSRPFGTAQGAERGALKVQETDFYYDRSKTDLYCDRSETFRKIPRTAPTMYIHVRDNNMCLCFRTAITCAISYFVIIKALLSAVTRSVHCSQHVLVWYVRYTRLMRLMQMASSEMRNKFNEAISLVTCDECDDNKALMINEEYDRVVWKMSVIMKIKTQNARENTYVSTTLY